MEHDFQVGDVVQLNSGSHKMTITDIYSDDESVRAEWFIKGEFRRKVLPQKAITKVDEET